jgi:hypothetical protein
MSTLRQPGGPDLCAEQEAAKDDAVEVAWSTYLDINTPSQAEPPPAPPQTCQPAGERPGSTESAVLRRKAGRRTEPATTTAAKTTAGPATRSSPAPARSAVPGPATGDGPVQDGKGDNPAGTSRTCTLTIRDLLGPIPPWLWAELCDGCGQLHGGECPAPVTASPPGLLDASGELTPLGTVVEDAANYLAMRCYLDPDADEYPHWVLAELAGIAQGPPCGPLCRTSC